MAKRKKASKQTPITAHALPLLKKPMEAVGQQIKVPGSFWQGCMSRAAPPAGCLTPT